MSSAQGRRHVTEEGRNCKKTVEYIAAPLAGLYSRLMASRLRVQATGGIYHITARGVRRESLYLDGEDRQKFLRTVARVVAAHGWRCHAYCLMTNHYHLLLETPEPDLSLGMQRLNGAYAQRFNWRHGVVGHVFERRFHSVLVESNWQLLELARYTALNPVRAGLCRLPGDWPWSSYRATTGAATRPSFLTLDWLLAQFGKGARGRERFAAFVHDALPTSEPLLVRAQQPSRHVQRPGAETWPEWSAR